MQYVASGTYRGSHRFLSITPAGRATIVEDLTSAAKFATLQEAGVAALAMSKFNLADCRGISLQELGYAAG
jgi:hypothetical protein